MKELEIKVTGSGTVPQLINDLKYLIMNLETGVDTGTIETPFLFTILKDYKEDKQASLFIVPGL